MFSQIRPGFVSYGRDEDDRAFMEFGPQLMIGIAERLSYRGAAGKIQSVIVNLEKYSALITQLRDGYLAISADRVDAVQVFEDVEPLIRRL